jgi:hypothetical protein
LAAKADRREKALDGDKNYRKRKKEKGVAVMLEVTQLTEQGVVLLERLGHGGSVERYIYDHDGDKYGGLLGTKGYKADVAALAKLEAKEGLTSEDKKKIKKDRNALAARRTRARQRVEAEKAERRVEVLTDLVEKLEGLAVLAETLSAEECYLVDLVSVI